MEHLQLNINWSDELLKIQHKNHHLGYCDLKLLCSDGYIKCHKALFPTFRQNELSSSFSKTTTESELVMTTWTLKLISKLVFIVYFGEAMLSWKESIELKPIFAMLQIDSTKRQHLFPRKGKGVQKRKAELKLKRSELIRRKVLAVRKIGVKDYEAIYVYGDGSEMVPLADDGLSENVTFYDENGSVLCDNDLRLFCCACSMIFCDSSDYLSHTLTCENNDPQMSTAQPIKVEPGLIKIEAVDNEENTSKDNDTQQEASQGVKDSINVCLICGCKSTSDLIIHSYIIHGISPGKDYELEAWKCRRCESVRNSGHLPTFLQHVVHCNERKAKQNVSRKRPASNNVNNTRQAPTLLEKRKRRKITEKVSGSHNNEIIIKEEGTAGNVLPESDELSPLANIAIIKVSSLAQPALDSAEGNKITEIAEKSGRNEESTSRQRNNMQMGIFSEINHDHKSEETEKPIVRRSTSSSTSAFLSTSKEEIEIANQPLPANILHVVNIGELSDKRFNKEQIPNRISRPLPLETFAFARALESRVTPSIQNTMCATNLKECKTGIIIQSELDSRSYTLNGKSCYKQRQSYGLTVDWCNKKTRAKKSNESRWPCRRCAKVFGTQRLFMHHSC
ncbi:unnamed protein product [Orchesella dallaii]|uniref:C2H2-type domain-containing protein n=1 Tax=Orchesella dallaii TaxID=48710 RepID=A0ABP1RNG5_9HEXA